VSASGPLESADDLEVEDRRAEARHDQQSDLDHHLGGAGGADAVEVDDIEPETTSTAR
jgi:hypothetical protein